MSLLRVFVAVTSVAVSSLTTAEPPHGDFEQVVELLWTAPDDCPSRGALEAMIRSQVVTLLDDMRLRVDASVTTTPAGAFVLELTLESEGFVEVHSIIDPSCDEATRQASTVVAASLDPFGLPPPMPPAAPEPQPEHPPSVTTEATQTPDHSRDVASDPAQPAARAYVNTVAGMSANFFTGQSVAPSLSGAVGVELGALRIGARGGGSAGARDGSLGLSMSSWDLGLSLGGNWYVAQAMLGVRGDFGAGSVTMRRDEARQSAAWLWTSALIGGGVAIHRRFMLVVEAGLGVSINRPQVVFADQADTAVAIAPLVFPRVHLGVDYRFR